MARRKARARHDFLHILQYVLDLGTPTVLLIYVVRAIVLISRSEYSVLYCTICIQYLVLLVVL